MKRLSLVLLLTTLMPYTTIQARSSNHETIQWLYEQYDACKKKAKQQTFNSDINRELSECEKVLSTFIELIKNEGENSSDHKKIDYLIKSNDLLGKEVENLRKRIEYLERKAR